MTFEGHKYLPKIRMAILTLALAGGMMFAIYIQPPRGSQLLFFAPKRDALLFYPYVVAALYTYVIWGPATRKFEVHIYARAFLILGLAIGWLYLVLEVLAAIDNTSGQRVLGCLKTSKYCQVRRSSDLMGAVAGFPIVIEVVLTLKYGRVDHNSTGEQERATAQGKDGGNEMFNNRHANLWKVRLLLIPFTLVSGGLFVANGDLDMNGGGIAWLPKNKAAIVISFASLAIYVYAIWGKNRSDLSLSQRPVHVFRPLRLSNGMRPWDDPCQILKTSQVIGTITGLIMLLEVIMTGRLGPLDQSLRKHHYSTGKGYQDSANVVIVRPDHVPVSSMVQAPVQPQVVVPMQPLPYPNQHPHPQYEILQHHP
ncbi:hypothetical protein BG006_007696 [Podila minutissima]|uniref:Uncharacterized protein n=1 Tax=Podila minutissima TaxID=64525 RepID=A0A9P5SKQ6_9FUNG|nr:hypothetical protein BG006_007696 [Podila minutissima]